MVDWWPWWVTTAVALPIAAVLLALALVAKRREARGALVLAGLVAVGLAVAAPFVMGSSMGSEPRLTAQEFARRADANCRSLSKAPAANFGTPKPTPIFAGKLDTFMPPFQDALSRQGQLRPPAGEQATATRWMDAMKAVGNDFDAMRDAARKSDSKAFSSATKSITVHSGQSARLSKQLGETYCFQ